MTDMEFADHVAARGGSHRQSFLASPRALAARTREFARLGDELRKLVTALDSGDEKTSIRQSPDRCIVQLGPVALTVAWLRNANDVVEAGELLVIVWHGSVAPAQRLQPERPRIGHAPIAPTALWEQVFTPVADSETSWAWHAINSSGESLSSTTLSARCVERLYAAYQEYSAAG